MLLEIRQTSLSRTLAAPMLVPQPSVLIQTELSPVFELEEFGFRFCDDGRILAGSYRLGPFCRVAEVQPMSLTGKRVVKEIAYMD